MMGLMHKIFSNTRKPEGWIGKIMAKGMNSGGHAALANWALQSFNLTPDAHVLDVGCGGGANLRRLLDKCPTGTMTGVDYSPVSVSTSRKYNRQAILDGRCRVMEGNVANLPFSNNSFDAVTAFETVYFWPAIEDSFRQVWRVLRPEGHFMIVNEADGENGNGVKWDSIVGGMHTYTPDELERHLAAAGFTHIEVIRNRKNHWLCLKAQKSL